MKLQNRSGIGKIPVMLCMLCMLFVTLSATLTVNAESNAKLTASAVTAEREGVAAVTFTLEGNPGIWGLKIRVDYDHSALTLDSVKNGSIFEDSEITLPSSLSREQFVFVAASNELEDTAANGSLVTLNFLVKKDAAAGVYPITAEIAEVINVAGKDVQEDMEIGIKSGSVTVKVTDKVVDEPSVSLVSDGSEQNDAGIALTTSATKTGDDNNPVLWIILLAVALVGGGACCYVLYMRRRRESH